MNAVKLNRKPLFDAVKKMLGRRFSKRDVAQLDAAIDAMKAGSNMKPDAPSRAERSDEVPAQTSADGIALIHSFEGCARLRPDGRIEAYPDPATGDAPWTIGWGSTGRDPFNGGRIGPGTVWTQEQCDQRAKEHLAQSFEPAVIRALGDAIQSTSQPQFDALVSFTYNVGPGNLKSSTLLKKHKAGDYHGAAREFRKWNKAAGRVLRGLTRRRAEEAKLYRSGI